MDISVATVVIAVIIFSVILHELGHAWAALKLGDTTAVRMGRLTLNPIPHIDPFMTIILPAVLYITSNGSFVFGGAKPVPVQPRNFTHVSPRKGMMLVAIAGPIVNFAIALGLALLLRLLLGVGMVTEPVYKMLLLSAGMNLFLGFLNMVPIPPLDGSKVLAGLIPKTLAYRYLSLERFGFFILLGILLLDRSYPVFSSTLVFLTEFFLGLILT